MALFALIELGSVLLISGFRRFSRLPVSRREQAVRDFRRSKLLPLRILGDALKASTTFIYMSHPDVLSHIGMVVACERPNDRLTVKADRGALGRMSGSP
jgi:hypothetical protein